MVLRVSFFINNLVIQFSQCIFPHLQKSAPYSKTSNKENAEVFLREREREREKKESSHCILWTKNVCACVRKRYLEGEWVRECARANVKAILANSAKFLSYSIFRFDWCQSLLWHSGRCTHTHTHTHTHALIHFFSFHRKCKKKTFLSLAVTPVRLCADFF